MRSSILSMEYTSGLILNNINLNVFLKNKTIGKGQKSLKMEEF